MRFILALLLEEVTHAILTSPLNKQSRILLGDAIVIAQELKRGFPELARLHRSVAHAREAIAQTREKYMKRTMDASRWSKLPENVTELIFARLPLRAIFRLRCLNKHWKSFVFSPSFQRLFTDVPGSRRPPVVGLFSDLIDCTMTSITFDTRAHEWFNRNIPSSYSSHLLPLVTVGGLLACYFWFRHDDATANNNNVQRRIIVMNPTTSSQRMLPPSQLAEFDPVLIKMETNEHNTKHYYTITLMYKASWAPPSTTTTEDGASWIIEIYDSLTDHWSNRLDMNSCNDVDVEGHIFKFVFDLNYNSIERFTYFQGQTRLPIENLLLAGSGSGSGAILEAGKTILAFDSHVHAYAFCWGQGSKGIWECACPWLQNWKKVVSLPKLVPSAQLWTSFWVWKKDVFLIGRREVIPHHGKLCMLMFDTRRRRWKEMEFCSYLSFNEKHYWAFETRFDAIP